MVIYEGIYIPLFSAMEAQSGLQKYYSMTETDNLKKGQYNLNKQNSNNTLMTSTLLIYSKSLAKGFWFLSFGLCLFWVCTSGHGQAYVPED